MFVRHYRMSSITSICGVIKFFHYGSSFVNSETTTNKHKVTNSVYRIPVN